MIKVEKIWITNSAVWIRTDDRREASERFVEYPRLKCATKEQRENYKANAFGIYWPDIDEDLSYEGFFRKNNKTPLFELFMSHPELNASAVARRMGIAQSLLAQYISGNKCPSPDRMEMIKEEIRRIGAELQQV